MSAATFLSNPNFFDLTYPRKEKCKLMAYHQLFKHAFHLVVAWRSKHHYANPDRLLTPILLNAFRYLS
jgi:hypothetical protein